ncbi:MAG: NfeD family protein, partial [Pirellulales bacterium]
AVHGRLLRVPLPVTPSGVASVKSMVQGAREQFRREGQLGGSKRPVLIVALDPGKSQFGLGSDFTQAPAIADVLAGPELSDVKTVAYIRRPIRGHGVLIAMACEVIIMAPDAEFGDAGADLADDATIRPVIRKSYSYIAKHRRTLPVAVALGMLDKDLEVHKVETEVSIEFVLSDQIDALRERRAIQSDEILIHRGELGRFSGREARELGFARYLAPDRSTLARVLGLPSSAVEEDPLLGRELEPRQLRIRGPIGPKKVDQIQGLIEEERRGGDVNFICLRIDSPGGSLADCLVLANYLAGLNDSAVRTVAYVGNEAKGGAAIIALASNHVIMQTDAVLGGAGSESSDADEIRAAVESIRQLRQSEGWTSWSLMAALIDPDLELFRYRHQETGEEGYFCAEEFQQRDDQEQWQREERIKEAGEPLAVGAGEAKRLGLAQNVVERFDDLRRLYGLKGDPRFVEPNWATELVSALANPGVAMLLLVIGGAALYMELQAPGIGIGGFFASVAFLLFFWSKYLDGTSTWLEVVLFLGGISALLLEIFVLPGFGVFGLGGGLMVIVSLVLASQTFVVPRTDVQLGQLRNSLLVVAGAGIGVMLAVGLLRRYLPKTPGLNRLMLEPLQGKELVEITRREAVVDFRHLLGVRGTTATLLTPAGKAQFGDELFDVISDGEVIDAGHGIMVTSVQGNRILVRLADGEGGAS